MSERNSKFTGPIKPPKYFRPRCVLVSLGANDSVNNISQDRINKATSLAKYLTERPSVSRANYIASRQISDDWRETFKQWGYEPCLD